MPQARLGDPLLDAAAESFDAQGWTGTTVERVAAIAKVPVAKALERFPSREHLAVGIFEQILARLPDEMTDEVMQDATLDTRLYFMLAHELRLLEPHKAFVTRAIADSFNPLSQTGLLQLPTVQRYIGLVSEQILSARARGEINSLVIPSVAAWNFWLLRAQVVGFWLLDSSDGSERTHAQADAWVRLFARTLNVGLTDLAMGFLNTLTTAATGVQARITPTPPVSRRRATATATRRRRAAPARRRKRQPVAS